MQSHEKRPDQNRAFDLANPVAYNSSLINVSMKQAFSGQLINSRLYLFGVNTSSETDLTDRSAFIVTTLQDLLIERLRLHLFSLLPRGKAGYGRTHVLADINNDLLLRRWRNVLTGKRVAPLSIVTLNHLGNQEQVNKLPYTEEANRE